VQYQDVTGAAVHRYIPQSQTSVYVLLGVYVTMQLASIFLHGIFLPRIKEVEGELLLTANSLAKNFVA